MNVMPKYLPVLQDSQRSGLPPWTYFNAELLELEKQELFRECWQLAGHVGDVPEPGDYLCLDMVGERAIVVRGKDGRVRAFHNVCRHRGSRVVAGQRGHCKSALVCPFHGWSFNLDGTLRAVPQPRSLPKLDPVEHGLAPLEHEIWHGFIFVRFAPGRQPSIAELLRPIEAEAAPYRMMEMQPLGPLHQEVIPVNWKAVRDVDNEGYHVPVAHPSLQDLYGGRYKDEVIAFGVSRSTGYLNEGTAKLWSVDKYKRILPKATHLPEENQRLWLYFGLFPNTVLMLYPDKIGFYQEYPLAVDRTVQRLAYYALPDERREMKAARYLSDRIDRVTGKEDTQLIVWSWESMQSSGFDRMILSDLEIGVRSYHDMLRALLPVTRLNQEPDQRQVAAANAAMRTGQPGPVWN